MNTKKIKSPTHAQLKRELDKLWIECIKARALYKSELSGKEGRKIGGDIILTSHHIVGKPNNYLRYLLDNGICLENGNEHIFGVHNKNDVIRARYYQDLIIQKIGQEKYNQLLSFRKKAPTVDLRLIKIYLQQKLEELT